MVSPGIGGVVCSCCTSRSTRTLRGDGSSPRRMITKVCARIVMVSLDLFRSVGLVGLGSFFVPDRSFRCLNGEITVQLLMRSTIDTVSHVCALVRSDVLR